MTVVVEFAAMNSTSSRAYSTSDSRSIMTASKAFSPSILGTSFRVGGYEEYSRTMAAWELFNARTMVPRRCSLGQISAMDSTLPPRGSESCVLSVTNVKLPGFCVRLPTYQFGRLSAYCSVFQAPSQREKKEMRVPIAIAGAYGIFRAFGFESLRSEGACNPRCFQPKSKSPATENISPRNPPKVAQASAIIPPATAIITRANTSCCHQI